MYYVGLILALMSGLLSIDLFRNFVRKLIPKIGSHHFDMALIAFLLCGLSITTVKYFLDQHEINLRNAKEIESKQTIAKLQTKVESQSIHIERQQKEKEILEQKVVQLVNKIQLDSSSIFRTPSGYSILLRFKSSRNEPLGRMVFEIQSPAGSPGKITDFWPTRYGSPFAFQENSLTIAADGKKAQLNYDLWGNTPALQINLSTAIDFEIRGNHDLEPIKITIDPKKNYPSGSERRHVGEGSIKF